MWLQLIKTYALQSSKINPKDVQTQEKFYKPEKEGRK
jgi:hypothetical protein